MEKLCLIDASGYIHRAFHAIPPLSTSKGEPINAVYGFSRMISKVLKEEKPNYLGICFDTPAPTFRHTQFTDYKANRKETDKALVAQLPLSEELARLWGLPCLKKDGYEADDLIATLARYGSEKGWQVVIFSGDKDILQLVNDNVIVKDEMKKVAYDTSKVHERYGIYPKQLIDYLSLIGDKVDNVSGVPGVGDKTASKLLSTYGNLEKMYEEIENESSNLTQKLKDHKSVLLRNRPLIRLDDAVPLELNPENLQIQPADKNLLAPFLKRLEFRSSLYGVDDAVTEVDLKKNEQRKVFVVLNEVDVAELEKELKSATCLSYDVETDSLNKLTCQLVGMSVAVKEQESWYIPLGHSYMGAPKQLPMERIVALLRPVFENEKVMKVGQNLKFDNTILARFGLVPRGPQFDTMVAAYCLDPARNNYGLKDMAATILQEKMTRFEELFETKRNLNFSLVPIEQAAPYAAADAEVTLRLKNHFSNQLISQKAESLFYDLEMPLVQIIQGMECAGVAIDRGHLEKSGARFKGLRDQIEKEIYTLAGETFVLNSPKQLGYILFEKLKLPPVKKNKTGYSTDEEVLTKLAQNHPICEKIIACRELNKLISTYVDSLLEMISESTGRIHTTFHQTGTITGRLSSTDPNLQNIPIRTENGKEIRKAFVPAKGNILMSADYSQIDLRSLAHMSEDPVLVKTFQNGGDVHTATASEMFHVHPSDVTTDMRRSAKAINFGIVYGQQAYALSQSLGIEMATAKDFISKYFERYAGVRAWIEKTLVEARARGFVTTLAGRKRPVPDITSSNAFTRGFAERVAVNTPIQGTSADIIKYAMIRVAKELKQAKYKTQMVLQVHDELVFDVPKDELKDVQLLVKKGMEKAFQLLVPLVADLKIGPNWNDMEKI